MLETMGDLTDLLKPPAVAQPVMLLSGGDPVARLTLRATEYPWIEYEFMPFDKWRELGEAVKVFSLSARQGMEGVRLRMKANDSLDLVLASDDGLVTTRDFLLHVRGDRAHVRSFNRESI